MRRLALIGGLFLASAVPAQASSDQFCTGSYGGAAPAARAAVRFGVDPGVAGAVGGVQPPSVPDDPSQDLAALRSLRPHRRALVLRLNRLFWSDGQSGINHFKRLARWVRYVRHVVNAFGANRHVVAMTITNEVNVKFSPNTSDGSYAGAEDALIRGIEAAHRQAHRRHFRQLRFGFTYAYRFAPSQDAAFFSYLKAHGGRHFERALGFVGLDFYPGTVYPPVMAPGDSYRSELAQAAGVVRDCFAPMAGIGPRVPIWITENGVPTGVNSEAQQAAALAELVRAVHDYSRTFNITDYRWFNLRDSSSVPPATLIGPSFSSDGLLRADYSRKPSFGTYRALIAQFGTRVRRH